VTAVLAATAVLLGVAALLTSVRLLRGPSTYDRLVALDTLVVIILSGILLQAAERGDPSSAIVVVLVALVGFLSSTSVLRLVPEDRR
jgi:multicomponent Na+:H+ antiporter subunit F